MINVEFSIMVAPIISLISRAIWHGIYTCILMVVIHGAFVNAKDRKWIGCILTSVVAIGLWLGHLASAYMLLEWLEIVIGG